MDDGREAGSAAGSWQRRERWQAVEPGHMIGRHGMAWRRHHAVPWCDGRMGAWSARLHGPKGG